MFQIEDDYQTEDDDEEKFILDDPMSEEEAERFNESYKILTEDDDRIEELARVTYDESLIKYRSPFFYGLITFERKFTKIDNYVDRHLSNVRGKVRDILEYLALVTIYSNSGLSESLIKQLMNLEADSSLSMKNVLGEGPENLIVRVSGLYRVLHQAIAENILQKIIDDDWIADVKDICVDFIRDSIAMAGKRFCTA